MPSKCWMWSLKLNKLESQVLYSTNIVFNVYNSFDGIVVVKLIIISRSVWLQYYRWQSSNLQFIHSINWITTYSWEFHRKFRHSYWARMFIRIVPRHGRRWFQGRSYELSTDFRSSLSYIRIKKNETTGWYFSNVHFVPEPEKNQGEIIS